MLIKDLIDKSKYSIKCPYTMIPKGICVHNTANDASAKNEIAYMKNNNDEVSFHIAIDDKEAIQAIPFLRNAWHAGDGESGEGNRQYIAIEICYSKSGGDKFFYAEKRAASEIALILKQYGWGIDKVKKHQDFSRKYCPHRTLDLGWTRFLGMIKVELQKLTTTPAEKEEYKVKEYSENRIFYPNATIKFRNKPIVSNDNPVVGQYYNGESVNYDYVVRTNKYVWISWISASTGVRRYMPVREIVNGTVGELWGKIV